MDKPFYLHLAMSKLRQDDIENPENLLAKPEQVIVLSLTEVSHELHQDPEFHLKPNPKGIYLRGHLMPVVTPGMSVFELETGKNIGYEQIAHSKSAICRDDGQILIPKEAMMQKKRYLNQSGFYPISALQILKLMIDKTVITHSRYAVPIYANRQYQRYLLEDQQHIEDEDIEVRLEDRLIDILKDLRDFMRGYEWNIFFTRFRGDQLYVERCVDWRIYEWTREQYNKYYPDTDN